MMTWNTDISQAPLGKMVESTVMTAKGPRQATQFVPTLIIVTTKCGKVTLSHYQPKDDRWHMLAKGEQPVAWMPWPEPYSPAPIEGEGRVSQ